MSTRAIRPWLALAVVPVLAFGLFLSGRMLLKCDVDGVARSACCCANDMHGDTASGPRVSERCCCDSTVVGPVTSTSTVTPRESGQPAPAAVVEAAPPSRVAPLAPRAQLEVARSAWPPNVPLFVLKSALLI